MYAIFSIMAPIALAYQALIHDGVQQREDDYQYGDEYDCETMNYLLHIDECKRKDDVSRDRTVWALQRIAEASDLSVFENDSESMSIALSNPALQTIPEVDEDSTVDGSAATSREPQQQQPPPRPSSSSSSSSSYPQDRSGEPSQQQEQEPQHPYQPLQEREQTQHSYQQLQQQQQQQQQRESVDQDDETSCSRGAASCRSADETLRVISMLYQHPSLGALRPALQNAIRYHAPLEIIQYIVRKDNTSLHSIDSYGNNILHLCLLFKADSTITSFLMDNMDPAAVLFRNHDGEFPLQLAVSRDFRAGCAVWDALLRRNPRAALEPQGESLQTVVHTVCSRYKLYPKQFLLSLIEHAPTEAWSQRDRMTGMTPLHYTVAASGNKPVLKAIRHVAAAGPAALMEKNLDEQTPLSMAFHHHLGILKALLSVAPEHLSRRDPQTRQTLLHQACYGGAPRKVIFYLVEQHPLALWMRDNHEMTPLHVAIQQELPKNLLDALYERNPTALELTDRRGEALLDERFNGVMESMQRRHKRKQQSQRSRRR